MGVSWADNPVKIWWNLPISNPKPDLLNFNAYSKFDENSLLFTKLSSENENMGVSRADNSVKIWRNLPISYSKQDLLNVNAYSKFGENPLLFTQVIVWKPKYGCVSADNSVKNWRNLPISNPKSDLHNINAHQVWWKSTDVYSSYHPERKYWQTDLQLTDGWMDGHTDIQSETIIPHNMCGGV